MFRSANISKSVWTGFHEEKVVGRSGEAIEDPEDIAEIGTAIIVANARGEHDVRVEI